MKTVLPRRVSFALGNLFTIGGFEMPEPVSVWSLPVFIFHFFIFLLLGALRPSLTFMDAKMVQRVPNPF
jgi:hypothetical protein